MGVVVQAGQRFASIADLQVGEGNQQAAVGTTVALLERGSRTMSAIHKRLYASMKREFNLLARVFEKHSKRNNDKIDSHHMQWVRLYYSGYWVIEDKRID